MKKVVGGLLICAVIVGVAALWWSTGRNASRPAGPTPTPSAAPDTPASPESTAGSGDSGPGPLMARPSPTPAGPIGVSASPVAPGPARADTDLPAEPQEPFLSDDEIAAAIAEQGGVVPVYRAASPAHREDILDYLMAEDQLRDALPALLPLETDSALRAYMLERTVPKGYFDDADTTDDTLAAAGAGATGGTGATPPRNVAQPSSPETNAGESVDDEPPVDEELKDLLDAAPSTPMTPEEWLARLDLALSVEDPYGLKWARKARDEGPADPAVQLLASAILLNLAQGDPSVGGDETRRAQQAIFDTLAAPSVGPDQRIRAYYALYFAPDRAQALDYLQRRRPQETDPRARLTLERLLERWPAGATGANTSPP